MPNSSRQLYSHLPDSYKVNNLINYFKYFIRNSEFDIIITNINKYINKYFKYYSQAN